MTRLWEHSASELVALFASGEASATEIVDAHLARIDEVNEALNAVVRRIDDRARDHAADLDRRRAAGVDIGPLAGVPFTIKDNIDLAGDPTTHGVDALAAFVPAQDAPIVERMVAAGAIPLARTNLPDMGLRLHTSSPLHGVTRNPWQLGRTAGGSSGGEGAALATGMSPIGLGNDLGGSLRNPATCCSIAAHKPTLGRVPHALEGPLGDEVLMEQLCAVEGPMARTVEDLRLGLQVLAGAHPRDPWSVPVPLDEPAPGPRRIAVLADVPGGKTDGRIVEATQRAATALSEVGHFVDEVAMPAFEAAVECWRAIVIGSIGEGLDELGPMLGADALSFLRSAADDHAARPNTTTVSQAWIDRRSLLVQWNAFFAEWDAVLTPTWTQLPFEHDADLADSSATLEMMRPVTPANVLGLPSTAVPAEVVDGLPVGVIVTGPAWSDMRCLDIAADIEAAGLAPTTPIEPAGG